MDWLFTAIGLLMMLGATAWLLATLFRKHYGPVGNRLERWWKIICDAFWGMG